MKELSKKQEKQCRLQSRENFFSLFNWFLCESFILDIKDPLKREKIENKKKYVSILRIYMYNTNVLMSINVGTYIFL